MKKHRRRSDKGFNKNTHSKEDNLKIENIGVSHRTIDCVLSSVICTLLINLYVKPFVYRR